MDLSERQLQILQAIITDYVENAEPVGSRSIAKILLILIHRRAEFLQTRHTDCM